MIVFPVRLSVRLPAICPVLYLPCLLCILLIRKIHPEGNHLNNSKFLTFSWLNHDIPSFSNYYSYCPDDIRDLYSLNRPFRYLPK